MSVLRAKSEVGRDAFEILAGGLQYMHWAAGSFGPCRQRLGYLRDFGNLLSSIPAVCLWSESIGLVKK